MRVMRGGGHRLNDMRDMTRVPCGSCQVCPAILEDRGCRVARTERSRSGLNYTIPTMEREQEVFDLCRVVEGLDSRLCVGERQGKGTEPSAQRVMVHREALEVVTGPVKIWCRRLRHGRRLLQYRTQLNWHCATRPNTMSEIAFHPD